MLREPGQQDRMGVFETTHPILIAEILVEIGEKHPLLHVFELLPDPHRDVLERDAAILMELAVCLTLIDRMHVSALQVLDDRHLRGLLIVQLHHLTRQILQPRLLRSGEAAMAGHHFISFLHLAHDQGNEHALLLDARDEVLELVITDDLASRVRRRLSQFFDFNVHAFFLSTSTH